MNPRSCAKQRAVAIGREFNLEYIATNQSTRWRRKMGQVLDSQTSRQENRERLETRGSSTDTFRSSVFVTFTAPPQDFTQKMVDAITKGLSPLGDAGIASTIYFLGKDHGVRLSDAFVRPNHFLTGLVGMFGLGAPYLESCIIEQITTKFDLPARPVSLSVAAKEAGRAFMAAEKTHK